MIGKIVSNLLGLELLMREAIDNMGGDGYSPHFFGHALEEYNNELNPQNLLIVI